MTNELEVRVSKLEGVTNKLAGLANNLQTGQMTIVEVIQELGLSIGTEIREVVSIEIEAKSKEIGQQTIIQITDAEKDIEDIKNRLKEKGLDRHQANKITQKIALRTHKLVGSKDSIKYILFYGAYRGRINKVLRQHYDVPSYKDIAPYEFEEALKMIDLITPESWFDDFIITKWKEKDQDGELKPKEQKALKKYLEN
ncbi:MAG TPA: ORF6C domain-containing protein [Candidatus Paceibacterota bacterium]